MPTEYAYQLRHDKTNEVTWALNEDLIQSEHLHSRIRVFTSGIGVA